MTDGVEIRKKQMKQFCVTFPDGFYSPIKKKVKQMKSEETCAIVNLEVYSTGAIYTRIVCLMSALSIKIKDVLRYELPHVPKSLFEENED